MAQEFCIENDLCSREKKKKKKKQKKNKGEGKGRPKKGSKAQVDPGSVPPDVAQKRGMIEQARKLGLPTEKLREKVRGAESSLAAAWNLPVQPSNQFSSTRCRSCRCYPMSSTRSWQLHGRALKKDRRSCGDTISFFVPTLGMMQHLWYGAPSGRLLVVPTYSTNPSATRAPLGYSS